MVDAAPLGEKIPDDGTTAEQLHGRFDGMDDAALDDAIDSRLEGRPPAPPAPPEKKEAAAPADEPPPADDDEQVGDEIDKDALRKEEREDEEIDAAAADTNEPGKSAEAPAKERPTDPDIERLRLDLEQRDAKLAKQEAHSARLAGELGHIKNLIRGQQPRRRAEPSISDELATDLDEFGDGQARSALEERLQRLEDQMARSAISAAIGEVIAELDARPDVPEYLKEIAVIAPRYKDDMDSAYSAPDVDSARKLARAAVLGMIADAKEASWQARHEEAERKRTETDAALRVKKRAAGLPSSSAPAPKTQRKPRTVDDLTDDQLDDLIDSRLRAGA